MKWICFFLGHKLGRYPADYCRLETNETDGIGRVHGSVRGKCARCGEDYLVARVHIHAQQKHDEVVRQRDDYQRALNYLIHFGVEPNRFRRNGASWEIYMGYPLGHCDLIEVAKQHYGEEKQ